ncbi:hypothetical protein M0P48_00960 [Candidatus Gracilibacteria bacterium]|jgi:hypothetical protein|nr:hypothetical protein [Candidatus Gracilibacteria bacterium]
MKIADKKNKILEFLKTSTIDQHTKTMVETLLPVMKEAQVDDLFDTFAEEKSALEKNSQKRQRVELKYKIMAEKLAQIEINKFKK